MDPRPLNRQQLAKICGNDPEAIRLLERLFQVAGQAIPERIEEESFGALADPAGSMDALRSELQTYAELLRASVDAIRPDVLQILQSGIVELSKRIEAIEAAPGAREFRRACYGQFLAMTTQTVAVVNTAYSVDFDVTDLSNGVYLSGTQVTVADAGVYDFQISAQIDKTSGGLSHLYLWIDKNGVTVPNSGSNVRVQGDDAETICTFNYLVQMAAGDYVELRYSSDSLDTELKSFAASAPVPAIPAVILTVSNNLEGVK